jgi:hypothetical protein
MQKRRELTFKLLFCLFTFGFHFCPPAFTFSFQVFSLSIFLFSSRRKEKKHKEKKSIEKKNAEKGGSLPSSSFSALSFLALASGLLLLPFRFKHFLLASSFSQTEEKKKNTQKNKIIEKKKKCREGKELHLFFRFCI